MGTSLPAAAESIMLLMNTLKRNSVSLGPGADSGWNWVEKKGLPPLPIQIPSLLPSLALVNSGSQPFFNVETSTSYPWF